MIRCADMSDDGNRLAFGDLRGRLELWDIGKWRLIGARDVARINDLVMAPDGTCVITGSGAHSMFFSTPERDGCELCVWKCLDAAMRACGTPARQRLRCGSEIRFSPRIGLARSGACRRAVVPSHSVPARAGTPQG